MIIENLNSKQKIILGIVAIVAIVLIIIYVYKEENANTQNFNLYTQEITVPNEEIQKNIIYVHITGEVENPGVVELEEGSRLNDLINVAGGLTESAEIKYLNLAQKIKDGEKLHIPSLDEIMEMEEQVELNAESNIEMLQEDNDDGMVNLNDSTKTELEGLPGIGEATAQKIIQYREENGTFNAIEDIMNVSGIGEAKFDAIKEMIEV